MKTTSNSTSENNILKNKSGASYIHWTLILLALLIIVAFVLSYVLSINVVNSQQKLAQIALDEYVDENAITIYSEVKENDSYTPALNPDEFIAKLVNGDNLVLEGDTYIAYTSDNHIRYKLSDISLQFIEDFTPQIRAQYTITVPLEFNGNRVSWISIPTTLESRFIPKFNNDNPDIVDDAPVISIASPGTTSESVPIHTFEESYIIKGTVSDKDGIAFITANGVPAVLNDDGTWEVEVPLATQLNKITVVALDNTNRASSSYVYLYRDGHESFTDIGGGDTVTLEQTLSEGGYFILQNDIKLSNRVILNGVGQKISLRICLNGHTITADNGGFDVSNATLTICDCSEHGNGKLQGKLKGDNPGVIVSNNGIFNFKGGIITNFNALGGGGVKIRASSATFNMSGGTISGNGASFGDAVYVDRGTFIMSGGKILNNKGYDHAVSIYRGNANISGGSITSSSDTSSAIHLREGTSQTYTSTLNISECAVIDGITRESDKYTFASIGKLSGGANVIAKRFALTYDANDKSVYESTDGTTYTYFLKPEVLGNPIAQVEETNYYYLADAIGAANGKPVKLLEDVHLSRTLYVETDVVLDLNGHNIVCDIAPYFIVRNGGNLTVRDTSAKANGKLDGSHMTGSTASGLVSIAEGGKFNLESGSICGHDTTGSGAAVRVDAWNAVFNMSGGTISGNKTTNYGGGVFVPRGTFNMTGGTITGNTGVGGGVCVSSNYDVGAFNMSGGTVTNNTCVYSGEVHIRANYSGKINLSGSAVIGGAGIMSEAAIGEFTLGASVLSKAKLAYTGVCVLEGETVVNGNTYWHYTYVRSVAQVGSVGYRDFATAIENANGKTVTLLTDIDIGSGITIPKNTNIILDLNGKTISGSSAPYFIVQNSTLTIMDSQSGGKLDGSSIQNSTGSLVSVGAGGTFNLESGTICGNITTGSGAAVRVDAWNAVFNMSGGTISGNETTNYGGGVFVPRGIFNMTGGVITGNTGVGGGVCIASDRKTTDGPSVIGEFNMSGGTVVDNVCKSSGEVHIRANYSGNINISGNAVIGGTGMRVTASIGNLTSGASVLSSVKLNATDSTVLTSIVSNGNKKNYLYEFNPQ